MYYYFPNRDCVAPDEKDAIGIDSGGKKTNGI
jgi:hypothetical protein